MNVDPPLSTPLENPQNPIKCCIYTKNNAPDITPQLHWLSNQSSRVVEVYFGDCEYDEESKVFSTSHLDGDEPLTIAPNGLISASLSLYLVSDIPAIHPTDVDIEILITNRGNCKKATRNNIIIQNKQRSVSSLSSATLVLPTREDNKEAHIATHGTVIRQAPTTGTPVDMDEKGAATKAIVLDHPHPSLVAGASSTPLSAPPTHNGSQANTSVPSPDLTSIAVRQ